MHIRIGFDIAYACGAPTPTLLKLNIERPRRRDLLTPETIVGLEALKPVEFVDPFGNVCWRGVSPAGESRLRLDAVVDDEGQPDSLDREAGETPVAELPVETLRYLQPSRYCESDALSNFAWATFGGVQPGFARVQAICDFVHGHIRFGYPHANGLRTALGAFNEGVGVCRDFAHLAVALCRALNIPARYCNGYLGDIGVPPDPAPMDFNAWFEAFIGGRWMTFDARHNIPRIGRIVLTRGLDAADCAMIQTFGAHVLTRFEVVTEEVTPPAALRAA